MRKKEFFYSLFECGRKEMKNEKLACQEKKNKFSNSASQRKDTKNLRLRNKLEKILSSVLD